MYDDNGDYGHSFSLVGCSYCRGTNLSSCPFCGIRVCGVGRQNAKTIDQDRVAVVNSITHPPVAHKKASRPALIFLLVALIGLFGPIFGSISFGAILLLGRIR